MLTSKYIRVTYDKRFVLKIGNIVMDMLKSITFQKFRVVIECDLQL